MGARPGRAILVRDEHALLTDGITETSAASFAQYTADHVPTDGNVRGSAAYRTHLVRVLVNRTMTELGGMCNGN